MSTDHQQALAGIGGSLGAPPRKFDRKTTKYLRMPEIRDWDASEYLVDADLLLEKGTLAWGAVVMANTMLYQYDEDGNPDAPGVVVFCPDSRSSITPEELRRIASAIYRLYVGETDDPELKELSGLLKQDTRPMRGYVVPACLSPVYRCHVSSLLYKRDHFPLHTLEGRLIPILHHPQAKGIVRMVPSRFWPREMSDEWKEKAKGKIPRKSLFARFGAAPLAFFLIKVVVFCLALLWLTPSTWSFIQQSEPLPEVQASGLSQVKEGTIIRFSGELDVDGAIRAKRRVYVPVKGTGEKVWLQQWNFEGKLPASVENQVSVLEQGSRTDLEFKEGLKKRPGAIAPGQVQILKSTAPPTMGMKLYRVGLLLGALLVLWWIVRKAMRAIRG